MDTWTKEQVDRMSEMGNIKSNALYCPNELRHPPPHMLMADERDSELEQYIRSKYEYKRFIARTTASSNPGSSTLRSQSTPLEKADKIPSSLSSSSGAARPSTTAIPSNSSSIQSRSFSQPMNAAGSTAQSHHISQPLTQQQLPARTQSLAQSPTISPEMAKGGVWNDLISLQTPSNNSSLPLQYQQQQPPFGVSNTHMVATPLGMNDHNPFPTMNGFPSGPGAMAGNPTGIGMSSIPSGMYLNPNTGFGMPSANTFQQSSQYPMPNTFSQGFGATGFNPMAQQQQQQQQTLFASQPQVQSPQPMSAPQGTQGPSQFNMMAPQGHSPQPIMSSTTPQLQGQFMSPSPQLQQPSQFAQQGLGGMGMGGMGYVQQQQQMFAGGNTAWAQPQGNFGQTWGPM
ncbi:hypothetical protein E1B28_006399 [Marasmius oreades]|nr:uncharacterized protein E1B28_006399 [Marasmius oreades]KAG7095685.1 hypothetical protein E1B28_006399 [Marasmius oreades]